MKEPFAKREMHSAVFTGSEVWVFGGKGIISFCRLLPSSSPRSLFLPLFQKDRNEKQLTKKLIDEENKPLLCTKLLSDALIPHFHEVLPRYLVLLILSFLRPMELTRFGQACRATRELAEEGKREGTKEKERERKGGEETSFASNYFIFYFFI